MPQGLALVHKQVDAVPVVMKALGRLEKQLSTAKTYEVIRKIINAAEAAKIMHGEVDSIKRKAEMIVVEGKARIAKELEAVPKASGGDRKSNVPSRERLKSGREATGIPKATRSRYKKLNDIGEQNRKKIVEELHSRGKDATVRAVLEAAKDADRVERRKSRKVVPLDDGMELRIGDCRKVLADVADESVALVLTDPPYPAEAEPLYRWLSEFSARVLIPGGSLICYTGHWSIPRDTKIFDEHLRYWWIMAMMHHQSKRLPGKFIMANFKPVLWYVKEFRRGKTLVPDVLRPPKMEKGEHDWGQGEGGVTQLIEHLTDPGELIVDPFAGTATWGRIAASMGRRWLGSDVVEGGDTKVEAA